MVTVLINNNLKEMRLEFPHNLPLYFLLISGILHQFLNNPAAVTMQTDKKQLPPDQVIDRLLLLLRTDLDVLLDDVVTKFVVDQPGQVERQVLEYLAPQEIVPVLQGSLDVAGTVLVPAEFAHVVEVVQDLLLRRIYRKVISHWNIRVFVTLVIRVLLLVLQTQPNSPHSYFRVEFTCN
jgi:hypothetical protein